MANESRSTSARPDLGDRGDRASSSASPASPPPPRKPGRHSYGLQDVLLSASTIPSGPGLDVCGWAVDVDQPGPAGRRLGPWAKCPRWWRRSSCFATTATDCAKARLKFLIRSWGHSEVPRSARNQYPSSVHDLVRPSRSSIRSTTSGCNDQGTRLQRRRSRPHRRAGIEHHGGHDADGAGRFRVYITNIRTPCSTT